MKTNQLTKDFVFVLLAIFNFTFLIFNCPAQSSAVMVNSNGILIAPANFFAANSNNLNAVVGPATSAQLGYVNLIPPTALYTNDTAGPLSGFGFVDYGFAVMPNAQYYVIITDPADLVSDGELSATVSYPGGIISTGDGALWAVNTTAGQPVTEKVFPISAVNAALSNLLVFSNATVNGNVQAGGTVTAPTFSGTFSNVAAQIVLGGASPANLAGGFLPLHESLMTRQMPVPIYSYATWFQYQVSGTNGTVTGLACTNMINQLVADNFVGSGLHPWLEIDEGWSKAGVIRTPGSQLTWNPALFPQGISAICAYAHANGVKVMLTTFYSDTFCGGVTGELEGSPPGYLYGDITNMLSWGVDGICLDSCGVGTSEPALRQMYLELDNGISHANSHPTGDFNDGLPAPQIVPTRVANGRAGVQQWSWAAVEGNIIFDGNDAGSGSPLDVYIKNINACYTNSWLIRPGHYYTCMNLLDSGDTGTNTLVYQMTAMAILPMPQDIASIPAADVSWFTNSEVVGIYQDPAVIAGILVSNVASAGPVFARQLGYSNGPVHAVAMFNTNTTSSENMTVSALACGISNDVPFTVWDPWSHTNLGIYENSFTASIPTNSARLYKFIATPSLVGGLIATNQSANLASTIIYTNATGGPVHLNVGLDTEVTSSSAGGTISSTVTATNNSSGQYSYSTASYGTTSAGYYSTNWMMVVSNGTQVTVTTSISGSPHYTIYSRVTP